jgi:hypothetical protein
MSGAYVTIDTDSDEPFTFSPESPYALKGTEEKYAVTGRVVGLSIRSVPEYSSSIVTALEGAMPS